MLKKGILGIRETVVATINSTQPLVTEVQEGFLSLNGQENEQEENVQNQVRNAFKAIKTGVQNVKKGISQTKENVEVVVKAT